MKRLLAYAAPVTLLAAVAALSHASTLESLSSSAELGFHAAASAPAASGSVPAIGASAAVPEAPLAGQAITMQNPVVMPRLAPAKEASLGQQIGSINLPSRLDLQRDMLVLQLGAKTYDIGVAGNKDFNILFLTFRNAGNLQIIRINNIPDLAGKGVNITLDSETTYNVRVQINIFDPIRGSTLKIKPVHGTQGPSHQLTTGALLDAMKARSYVFTASGSEYWLLYTTDVDPDTNQLANTRSLVFFHEAGTNSKGYPVAESSLQSGQPVNVALGDAAVSLAESADGTLTIYDGGSN